MRCCAERLAALLVAGTALAAGAQTVPVAPASASAPPAVAITPGVRLSPAVPGGRWTPAQLQQAFNAADADGNGELSRAEAQQLYILPRSFEDMDQNKDGVITRAEYERPPG